ncbi:MAG: glycosyltransferase family 4 protein [Nitrospirae bacterium]|nr:glycosyltransferase family 4 protein [Nitrospirota bacterium]
MRLLYLCASAQIGGGNRSLLSLWDELLLQGTAISAVCPSEGPMVQACVDRGISCCVMRYDWFPGKNIFSLVYNFYRWWKLLKDIQPDIIHANERLGNRAIALPAKTMGIPLVCHVRYPPTLQAVSRTYRWIPQPDFFIFNSYALQNAVGSFFSQACPRTRQQVIYNGVNLQNFPGIHRNGRDPVRIGIVANLLPVKGHDSFLEMAHLLVEKGVRAEFWIVGEDIMNKGYDQHLQHLATTLNLDKSVHFLGFRDDIPHILSQIDILVSSSSEEPFGRSICEAMACELPVVATAVGGVVEVIDNNKTGILVPGQSPSSLADAVESLIKDGGLRKTMGQAGRQRVKDLFSNEAHAKEMKEIYRKLLGKLGCKIEMN